LTTVIAMTAHAMDSDRKRCLDAGMNGYISKPISLNGIADILKAHLPESVAPKAEV
jgi:two-component system, sensor histidine kinase and response regulator